MANVEISFGYSLFYWLKALVITLIIVAATAGAGLPVVLLFGIYKWRVINRSKIVFERDTNRVKFQRGRIFVLDDDVIPVRSIDNVKLDRSILGKIFGWCDIAVFTRVERYKLSRVSTRQAEAFRLAFLAKA